MKTKMILVQFLWQKNVNLTVARLAWSDPTFASTLRWRGEEDTSPTYKDFRSLAQVHPRLG